MKIRLLRNEDLKNVLEFLSEDYVYNAETLGIIEKVGLEGKFFQLYGFFEQFGVRMIACLFVNRKDANLYFPFRNRESSQDISSFFRGLKLVLKNLGVENLSVDFAIKSQISDFLEVKGSKNQYLCVYNKWAVNQNKIGGEFLRERLKVEELCGKNELQDVANLHFKCFGQGMNAWKYKSLVDKNLVKLYGIYEDNKLLCKGEWMCADAKTGYISGLCTDVSSRGRGLCSLLLFHLTEEILNSGGLPVLSYEEENLRSFYDVLGFECMYIRSVLWLRI